jgi:hypothetical protein
MNANRKKHKLHVISKEPAQYRRLCELAATLPELQKISKQGNALFKADSEFTGTSNFTDKGYNKHFKRHSKPVLVNHKVELIDAYEYHGEEGVQNYLGRVNFIVSMAKAKENAAKQAEGSNQEEAPQEVVVEENGNA